MPDMTSVKRMSPEDIPELTPEMETRRKERRIAALSVVSACIVILFYFTIDRWDEVKLGLDTFTAVITPFIIGFVMAFFMNPIMMKIEKPLYKLISKMAKKESSAKKVSRMIATILSLIVFLGIIALFFVIVIPSITDTVKYLSTHIADSATKALDWVDKITDGRFNSEIEIIRVGEFEKLLSRIYEWLQGYINVDNGTTMLTSIASGVYSVGRTVMYLIIGIIVSVYVVSAKETFKAQSKKVLYSVCRVHTANIIMEIVQKAKDIFYGFIIGKIIDSLIIGVICYIAMLIFKFPYPVLISVIIGVTNIIPVFGPYFGAIPTFLLIFLTNPMQGIYFIIMILVLQQIDGNIIGPKILGSSTGLSAFWVVVAIIIGGGLFGVVGMIIGVPITAVIYYLAGQLSKYLLARKGLPTESVDYISLKQINEETLEIENIRVEENRKSGSFFTRDIFEMIKNKKNKKNKSK